MPVDVLVQAEKEASRIFQTADVQLVWTNCRHVKKAGDTVTSCVAAADSFVATVTVLREPRVGPLHRPRGELGFTIPGTSFVFFDRVQQASAFLDFFVVLGHVLAHELGHQLGLHHSPGLMSADVGRNWLLRAEFGVLRFTPGQAREMQNHLQPSGEFQCSACQGPR